MKNGKRIESITLRHITDVDPDTSYMGQYSDRKSSEYSLDRAHDEDCPSFDNEDGEVCTCGFDGYWHNREYRYFNPFFNYVDKNGHALEGNTPEDVRKYVKQDYERMESMNKGHWNYIGIRAEAKIVVEGHIQRITSGGLWGIETDSEEGYFAEVESDELADLKSQLKALGFGTCSISAAFKTVDRQHE